MHPIHRDWKFILYIQEYLATEHVGISVYKFVLNIWYKGWVFEKYPRP